MPDLFDGDGKAVVAFTEEEVKEKIEEANKTVSSENATKLTELEGKVTTLEEEKKLLEKGEGKTDDEGKTDKEMNFEKMRVMIDDKDTKIGDLQTQINNLSTGFDQKLDSKRIEDTVSSLSGGDKELGDKIRFHFENFKIDPEEAKDATKREDGFKKRMENAYMLASGGSVAPSLQGNIVSSSGGYVPPAPGGSGSTAKMTDEAKKLGQDKMGISEEDIKKAEEKGLI